MRAGQSVLVDGRAGRARWRAWVVSPRHGNSNESQKAFALSNNKSRTVGDHTGTLAMPNKSTVPNLGTKCGRRERESRREGRREQSLRGKSIPSRVVAVKDIPIFWKAVPFAGCCRNEGLGRSIIQVAVSPATSWCADDSECPKDAEEGNVVSMRHKAYAPNARHE
jgi:hypothetical protein